MSSFELKLLRMQLYRFKFPTLTPLAPFFIITTIKLLHLSVIDLFVNF